ncbi:MAG: sensor histidine kinase [Elusimicrobiota bacterium]
MEGQEKILILTADSALYAEVSSAFSNRNLNIVAAETLAAAARFSADKFAAVIADLARLSPADRAGLLQAHAQRGFPLFLLETLGTLSPRETASLKRLPWPPPAGFMDLVRTSGKSVVFLADQALFASRALQMTLQQSGIQPLILDSALGVGDTLTVTPARSQGLWEKIVSRGLGDGEDIRPRVIVAQFLGGWSEAASFDDKIRQAASPAICYLVSSLDPLRLAAKDIQERRPAIFLREEARKITGLLVDNGSSRQAKPHDGGRILLLDNYKPTLESMTQALAAAKYEVVATMDSEQAFKLAQKPGSFHLAIIGAALAYTQRTGAELAQILRERDPDLRIIFMVDQYPLPAALKGMSQIVELGLDDALLKPVEPSRLIFSVQRALERRFLIMENARLLKEIQESNRQLAQINGFQSKFFAMVAHDVKNPLTAILGYAEVLQPKLADRPADLKSISHIYSAAKTLNILISDLVDLAAIESGKLRVNLGPMDLAAVINDVRSRIDIAAAKRKIAFIVDMPQALPRIWGDPARIGQVIQNLCTNAIQYTKENGRVSVCVESGAEQAMVSVKDTGIGISKQDLPRIFERFFQSEEAQAIRKAGFGLGLKISREIVQMHGGDMGVESELGVGSRFYFTLPVYRPK